MDGNFFARLDALNAKKAELQKEQEAIREDALQFCRKLVVQFSMTAGELGVKSDAAAPVKVRKAPAPKYQNPDGAETWSGRGARPVWFKTALEAGFTAEDMLIEKPAA